jgi:hypothetical protein
MYFLNKKRLNNLKITGAKSKGIFNRLANMVVFGIKNIPIKDPPKIGDRLFKAPLFPKLRIHLFFYKDPTRQAIKFTI